MRRINGDANVSIAEQAKSAGVKRMAYVSAQPFRPIEGLLPGYFGGKKAAEEAVSSQFGSDGAVLRPPAVYGTRVVSRSVSVPLGALGVPLTAFLETSPMRSLAAALPFSLGDFLSPWVSVDDVAGAAVAHVIAEAPTSEAEIISAPAAAAAEYGNELRLQRPAGEAVVLHWKEIREAARRVRAASAPAVTLFWDGGCPLCQREIAHYKQLDVENNVEWVDIHAEPSRLQPHQVTPADAMELIHAVDKDGALQVGVPAFLAVWEQLPYWSVLPPLMRNVPLATPAAAAAYTFWAKNRLQITNRKLGAGSASCSIDNKDACK